MTKRISIYSLAVLATLLFSVRTLAQTNTPKINMTIHKELLIDTPIEKAWQVLGPEFSDAYKWASTVKTSKGQGEKIKGIYSERVCETTLGALNEKVLQYAPEDHLLSYTFEGMPKVVRYTQNTWQLTSIDAHKTKLTLTMEVRVGGVMGIMMKPMMRGKMSHMMKHTIEEFKYYAETGNPHPRKVKAINKLKRKKS